MTPASGQKRTPFKSSRATVPFSRTCIQCHRALTTTFLFCQGNKCSSESKRKIRQQMKVGEYAKP